MFSWLLKRFQSQTFQDEYDYIIIGAGSAGCVLAKRLSENPDKTVLLLEAGSSDDKITDIGVPAAFITLQTSDVASQTSDIDWNFKTVKQANACKAWPDTNPWVRGKCLGGSSSINGMAYTRGDSSDYDNWEKLGAEGWNWENVLKYFLKSENCTVSSYIDSPYHATGGLLTVSDQSFRTPISDDFITAGKELGFKEVDVSSGKDIIGVGKFPATIQNNTRASTSKAFLKPAIGRPNLTVLTNALVTKVIIENKRAVGVNFVLDGNVEYVRTKGEVILSAGAVSSPQILMLSGVGPKSHLEEVGIECIQDLPVGENLQDHYGVFVKATVTNKDDVIMATDATRISSLKYRLGMKSLLATNGLESTGFFRSGFDEDTTWPDYQIHFYPTFVTPTLQVHGEQLKPMMGQDRPHEDQLQQPGVNFFLALLHPKSTGYIKLKDTNPESPPIIEPNYLDDEYDIKVLTEAMQLMKRMVDTECFKAKGMKLLDIKMPGISAEEFSEENLSAYIRHFGGTLFHPCGTCKMGSVDDSTAVVDPQLRVRGIEGLRVIDGSIMPHVVSGNTNAPCIMIGEKGADLVKNKTS